MNMAMEALSNNKVSEYPQNISQNFNGAILTENSGDTLSGNIALDGIRN